jgi:PPOX class probable F420-dependent enzyme
MPSRREQIRMSDDELRGFLVEQKVMNCATVGPHGRPHVMPLWYVPDGVELSSWTYAASQKARNLERDPRATVEVEAGVEYHELRGAMLECDVELVRDNGRVAGFGRELFRRYAPGDDPAIDEMVDRQAPKRVALIFSPTRIITWDHRKLGGTY